jgi:hypothetical protein
MSIRWFFIVSSMSMQPPSMPSCGSAHWPTSCIRSLSELTIVTSHPRRVASLA